MKRYVIALAALLFSASISYAQGVTKLCITTTGSNCIQIDATNPLPVTSSGGGAASTNITQILGNPVSVTNPLYVSPATGATFPVSGTLSTTQSGTWNIGSITTLPALAAGTNVIGSVTDVGSASLTTAQVSITTASTQAVAARAGRRAVTITNITGTQPIFCTSGTATLVNGQLIPAVAGSNFTFPYTGVVNCIASTGAQTVSVTETH